MKLQFNDKVYDILKWLCLIALPITFCVLTIQNAIPENFMNVYTMVVTFYFVKQLNTETGNGNGG